MNPENDYSSAVQNRSCLGLEGDVSSKKLPDKTPADAQETIAEQRRRLIGIVKAKPLDPVATGFAISQLNQPVLYAPATSFEAFLRNELKLSRAYANRLIRYSEFAANFRTQLDDNAAIPPLYLAEFIWKSWEPDQWLKIWHVAKVVAEKTPVGLETLRQLRVDDEAPIPKLGRRARQWPPRRVTTAFDHLIQEVRGHPQLHREHSALVEIRDNLVRDRRGLLRGSFAQEAR